MKGLSRRKGEFLCVLNLIKRGEGMKNYAVALSIVFLGLCIVMGSWVLKDGFSVEQKALPKKEIPQS